MEDKSPSFCRLCNVSLASPSAWREHAKSDWHVYNLRVRVAEPGAIVTPPSASPRTERAVNSEINTHSDDESDEGDIELSEEPEFNSEQCLFCGVENDTFDDNLAHMSKTHSFTIPYQDYLTVDLETLIEYLYLVIYRYGECVLCAARRSTVEGIQHHMMAKGHCRFNVASDIEELYNIPASQYHADEDSLRLPSGRLLSHRTRVARPVASRTTRQLVKRRPDPAVLPSTRLSRGLDLVPAQGDDTTAPLFTELSQLSRGDQQSLAHLPDHEVRSLLATSARHIDQLRREENQAQVKLSTAGNTTLTAHFRADTSKRFRGPWG